MEHTNIIDDNNRTLSDRLYNAVEVGLTTMPIAAREAVILQTKHFMETIVDYKDLMMMYSCAIREIETKFEILNTEFKVRYYRNPISAISTRLKSTKSISEKLARHNLTLSRENIEEYIHDVAGVRIICSYIDDIYLIAESLLKQDDITLITKKDYIANPKSNGYRSLHLIVEVPVFFADHKKNMKVEVQIRTIAMDFWASLEHQLKYKQDIPNQEKITEELRNCSDIISQTDEKMLSIRQQIEATADAPTDEDILFDKISRIDMNI